MSKVKKLWDKFISVIHTNFAGMDDVTISEVKHKSDYWSNRKIDYIRITKKNAISIEASIANEENDISFTIHNKQKSGGYALSHSIEGLGAEQISSIFVRRSIDGGDVENGVNKLKHLLESAPIVQTEEKPKKVKTEKFKQVAELEVVDLMAEFLAPLIVLKFKTYIYSSSDASNPDSKVQVRCDFWFNRDLKPQQFVAPEGKEISKKYSDYPRRYMPRVLVDLDTKELLITEKELADVKIIGIMNIDEIIARICKSISGLKSNEEKV